MSNNISIQALKGNVLTNISINDIIKNMNNDKSETHNISEIIDLQKKNEKRKIKLYTELYNKCINIIYNKSCDGETTMIYTIPYMHETKYYNNEEYTKFLSERLRKDNIAIVPYKLYDNMASDNQYFISWRFIGCKK